MQVRHSVIRRSMQRSGIVQFENTHDASESRSLLPQRFGSESDVGSDLKSGYDRD